MKNVILGMISLFIVIYLMLISMNVYLEVTETNKMERKLSRAVTNCLEAYYKTKEEELAKVQLKEDILMGEKTEYVEINIRKMDLEKGILSVDVKKRIPRVTGDVKTITLEKTAIMERIEIEQPKVSVTFLCEDVLYKKYDLTVGEICPIPKLPDETYGYWVAAGGEALGSVHEIGAVFENQVYYAKKD